MIPDEAVEAAAKAVLRGTDAGCHAYKIAYAALEAALPYLSDAARQPQRTSPTDWPDVPSRQ